MRIVYQSVSGTHYERAVVAALKEVSADVTSENIEDVVLSRVCPMCSSLVDCMVDHNGWIKWVEDHLIALGNRDQELLLESHALKGILVGTFTTVDSKFHVHFTCRKFKKAECVRQNGNLPV